MASHDAAIRKYKNFKESRNPLGVVSSFGQNSFQRSRNSQNRFSSSLIMKPVMEQMRQMPGLSFSKTMSVKDNLRPCSLQCPGTNGAMPELQCVSCKRLFHARCQVILKQLLHVMINLT
jgi:hypothetical protein